MSDIAKYTVDGDVPIYEFARACEEMKNVKFIMAEEKMRELLITIATSSALKKIVAEAAKGFDFGNAFVTSRIKTGKRHSLLPPVRRKDLIAYAVNLLYAFDTGAISLQDFLEEFYFSTNGINFSFIIFVRSIIIPLRDAVLAEASVMELPITKRPQKPRPIARPAQRQRRAETAEKTSDTADGAFRASDGDTTDSRRASSASAVGAGETDTAQNIIYNASDETVAERSETESPECEEIAPSTAADESEAVEPEPDIRISVEPPENEAGNPDDIVEVDALPDFIEAEIPNDVAMDLITRLGDIYTEAAESGLLKDTELSELYSVANALATGITERSAQMIRTLMTGFTGVIRAGCLADRLSPEVAELDKVLRSYGV